MLAIVQQRGQLWQCQLPGVFEGGIGCLIVFDGQVEPAHAFLLDLTAEVRQSSSASSVAVMSVTTPWAPANLS